MKKILILMSTYNGEERVIKQIDSIINQKNVEAHILIRDDGSNDKTKEILKDIQKKYINRIEIIFGSNIGWKKSFVYLLNNVDLSYDYYGFSDQDDIWLENKCYNCILEMEKDDSEIIKLCHCNNYSVDESLTIRGEQEYRIARPKSHKNAFAMEYFQGCGMVWNCLAMKLLKNTKVTNPDIAHDFWVGLVCYLFGNIFFIEEPQFYHIRYSNSESSDGSKFKGRLKRVKQISHNTSIYMNPSKDLLNNFREKLSVEDVSFLEKLEKYKYNIKYKMNIIFDKDFCRNSLISTIFMKGVLILNKY